MSDAPCLICRENHNNLPCPKSIVRDPMPDATYQPKPALFELIDGLLPDLIPRAEAEAMVQTERGVWTQAIETYFNATAVMDVERYASAIRAAGKDKP